SYMDEAALCDRVALLQNGHILSVDSPEGIRRGFGRELWAVKAKESFRLLNQLREEPAVESCYPFGRYHHVVLRKGGRAELEDLLRQGEYTEAEVAPAKPGIEDCFIALMK
ncbi:MAG TPA: hypothetical protein VKQ52_04365, partial [Puia sp.]|nr:hypothetical protein [Puia sp.]